MDNQTEVKKALEMLAKLEAQIAELVPNTSCMAGRKVCIDCSFQEIENALKRIK